MQPVWRNIRFALLVVTGLWAVGSLVLASVFSRDVLAAWSAAAVVTAAIAIVAEIAKANVAPGPQAFLKSVALSFSIRGGSILAVLLVFNGVAAPPTWIGSLPALAISFIPYYFVLLAVEIFAARPILVAPAAGTSTTTQAPNALT